MQLAFSLLIAAFALTTARPVDPVEPQNCGKWITAPCPAGTVCHIDSTSFNLMGVCKAVEAAQPCGKWIKERCPSGTTCKVTDASLMGVCTKVEAEVKPQSCGKFITKPCPTGTVCHIEPTKENGFSLMGVCKAN
jgi:hypothetical protein